MRLEGKVKMTTEKYYYIYESDLKESGLDELVLNTNLDGFDADGREPIVRVKVVPVDTGICKTTFVPTVKTKVVVKPSKK